MLCRGHNVMIFDVMTRHEIKALLRGSTSEDQAKLVLDHLAAHPYEAVQIGNTTKAACLFE